jgi:hypothetical protein
MTPGDAITRCEIGDWVVRSPAPADRERWGELFTMYGEFYKRPVTGEMADRVWSWIRSGHLGVRCLVVCRHDERPIGLAHFRTFARPLAASVGGYLDDLFVDEAERAAGAVDALFLGLGQTAQQEGWSILRGITADDNYRARAKYDQFATRTKWVTYEVLPENNPINRSNPGA